MGAEAFLAPRRDGLGPVAVDVVEVEVFDGPVEDRRVAVGLRAPPTPGVELVRRAEEVTVRGAEVVRPNPAPIPGIPLGVAGLLDAGLDAAGLSHDEKKSSPASPAAPAAPGVPAPEPVVDFPPIPAFKSTPSSTIPSGYLRSSSFLLRSSSSLYF